MDKQTLWLGIILLGAIILVGGFIYLSYDVEQDFQGNLTKIEKCEATGGSWEEFANACADTCEFNRNEQDICAQVITNSCYCGVRKCWNGNSCVSIE
ncbi:MAG: hypothetical protein ACOCUT_02830 [bacterium]